MTHTNFFTYDPNNPELETQQEPKITERNFDDPQCRICGEYLAFARWEIGKRTCLECGEEQSRQERAYWCVAPISNKAAYTLITDTDLLKQINPKRTT